MERKSITTSRAAIACDVCGRTLLRGEQADAFIANGSRRMVCELCTARAANEGWIREGADNTLAVRRNGPRGGPRSLFGRLKPARRPEPEPVELPYRRISANVDRIQQPAEAADDHDRDELVAENGHAPRAHRAPVPGPVPGPVPASEQDAQRTARDSRQVHAVPTNADLKMARALDVFNLSAHPRRIAGVARSLGVPIVSVLPSEVEGAIVSIVVGWELCWYRYEVDLADEAAGVRVLGQGSELAELTDAERLPNAAADERGRLVLAS
ncbi:MAG: hypothetical protein Q8O56_08435 [Solirubrobacteraceae bacterium]|nr:hypothetical protein [Solirubrobacteraceae bacterium]